MMDNNNDINNVNIIPHKKCQINALTALSEQSHDSGTLLMSVRSGKSRVIIEHINKHFAHLPHLSFLWLVFDTDERDTDLELEFNKWNCGELFTKCTAIHPSSLKKLDKTTLESFDLIIYNECHTITPTRAKKLEEANCCIIGMTGTYPNKRDKKKLLESIGLNNILFEYSLDDAARDGEINDYKIKIISVPLDTAKTKLIKYKDANNVERQFYTSEHDSISRLSSELDNIDLIIKPWTDKKLEINTLISSFSEYKFETNDNKRILRSLYSQSKELSEKCKPYWLQKKNISLKLLSPLNKLESKIIVAKKLILKQVSINNERTLVLAMDSKHCNSIGKRSYNSKTNKEYLNLFMENKPGYLILVEKAATGKTFNNIDNIILLNVNSSNTKSIQKFARGLLLNDSDKPLNVTILISKNTIQEKWVKSALIDLDKSKIEYLEYEQQTIT